MSFMKFVVSAAVAVGLSAAAAIADTPVLRLGALKFGTVNWELDTIKANGFDTSNGFELDVQGMAGGSASKIAFQGGEVDVIVSDWIWVARQRAAGHDYRFIPYSKAVGGVVVPADSSAQTLADLAGGKIGIAGGPLDKSWIILQAYAAQQGFDLKAETEQVFGAPPLIFKTALGGDLDGAINFWHFMAKMEAGGMRKLIDVADAATALGLDPNTPLLGYVYTGEFADANPEVVAGLAAASRAAKDLLGNDDAAWEPLRGRMKPKSEAQFIALRDGFRAGIPAQGDVDETAAAAMFALMAKLGGEKLVGEASDLPAGVFYQGGS